jgi:ABC-type multidrug transport system ATPase subunit
VDQLDRHAPRLTVQETLEFSANCRNEFESDEFRVFLGLLSLGLNDVKDTFVGDATVRGVSGGQRRRVTVGEMMMLASPVFCGDEISTGLDSASTYDMCEVLCHFGRIQKLTRIVSLLQPSPDTVSLFDVIVLLAEGFVLYAGTYRRSQLS